jgi:hypothetical protein
MDENRLVRSFGEGQPFEASGRMLLFPTRKDHSGHRDTEDAKPDIAHHPFWRFETDGGCLREVFSHFVGDQGEYDGDRDAHHHECELL